MNRFTEFELVKQQLTPIAGYWAYPLVSLEQALAPLSSKINELDRSIKEVKKHCVCRSEYGLTLDESAALFLYTMEAGKSSFYRILNKTLRNEDRSQAIEWFHYLKLFDTALRKLPSKNGCIWRGVSGDLSKYYNENDIITWWSITSCSLSAKESERFLVPGGASTLFMIECVNGKNISGYSIYPNENEIVLGIGSKFRVISNALKHGKLNVVHLKELESNGTENVSNESSEPNGASVSLNKRVCSK
ncbi:unnamed protein product [Rotaria socialis]|nr:unnamed protein product [Rotaria socialis]